MARGNRQRPPLHHFAVSDSNAATNPNLRIPPRTSSTINTKTSISAASSNIPTAISPSTPISSSIQSFSSVHSTTVTSHLNSTLKDKDKQKDKSKNNESDMNKLTKPKGGFFGSSKSTTNSTTSVSKNANPASKKQGNNQDNRGTTSSISKNDSSAPVLPLLLSDDFDFSLPFLSDSISTANSSSSASKVSPTPVVITSSAPLTLSSPSISALSPSYPHSRPPNSSSPPSPRVQDYIDSSPATPVSTAPTHVLPKSGTNSSLYNNNSSSQKKPTEIIHQSTRRGSSRPEISDYFVGNNDDLSTKQSSTKSLKSLNKATHESDFSNHERSETPANTRTPTNDDYQTPPRFVIRQPSRPALSNEFETTSKPSSTISMISLGSSSHAQSLKSQQRQLNRHTIDTPLQQKQMSDVSRSSPSPRPVAIVRKERAFSDVSTRPSEIKSLSSSAKSSPVSTKSLTTGIEPNSPNLRSRLTRLFRPNPKSDRPSSSNLEQQRRRSSQQKITNQTQGSSIPRPRGLTVPAPTSKMQGRLQGSSQLPSQLLPQSKLEQLSHQKQEHQQEQTASLLPLILPTSNLASNFTQDLSSQNSFSVTDNPPDILVSEGKQYEADSSRGAERYGSLLSL
ncbi:hypothetical protein BCR41DRAFT_198153 [Lobosporangium transversale]|uniref:Uncharacterized protein n=1 Tax=Lobosporangium transversale TaxID=64571 RepID=A0A1Y2G8V2_9FUNG|nr:hypothetical protein BCR41DRAFT_198153 [Lobosporangium transversale]ORZ04444.1 hypothetical protein BCR41DRAFT_198153 [Lobosporangium transversale]|eukprot:XP_021876552.1 hypothetical protein BCR41DRAFT_198153 [Lobosporangium transversale]